MKKEEILALGVAEDVAQKIVEMAAEEIKGSYVPKSRFDEVNEAKKNAEALVKERDGQLETLKASAGDSEALKQQIADLQEANKAAVKEHEANLRKVKRESIDAQLLAEANAKNPKAVAALLDPLDDKLDDDAYKAERQKQLEALIKAEDSSFLFGSNVPNVRGVVPANGQNGAAGQDVDFSKMNYEQLSEYLAANPDAKIS